MLSKSLLIAALLILITSASAQVQMHEIKRYERPAPDSRPDHQKVAVAGKHGLLLYRNSETALGLQLDLTRLDTTLTDVWGGFVLIDRGFTHQSTITKNNIVYLLYKPRYGTNTNFLLITVNLITQRYSADIIPNLIPFNSVQFAVTNNAAIIGGYFNNRPLVLFYDFIQKQFKILPGFLNEEGELNQLRSNPDGTFDVIVNARNADKKNSLWMRSYDRDGNINKNLVVSGDKTKSLNFGSSLPGIGGEQVVCGVYGRYPIFSRGVFVAVINPDGVYTIRYYNFSELQRFFNYMRAARERRIKDRIERKKVKGKKAKFNYRFQIHQLIPYDNQVIMVGEAFYPHYTYASNRPSSSYAYNARLQAPMMSQNRLVFDGYQYTHAVVIGFDKNGKLLWDNSFEINDVRKMQMEPVVTVLPDEQQLSLLYLHDNILRTKIIKNSEVLEGKSKDPLTKGGKKDKEKVMNSQLEHWYGDYFITYGNETIPADKKSASPTDRKIFFVTKFNLRRP